MSGARIRIHDDGCGRLHLRWWADDSMLWRQILESVKARFPSHHDRSYSAQTRTWSVPRSRYGRLAEWVDYWFDADDQQWDDEEPGGYRSGSRSYTGGRSSYGSYRQQASTCAVEAAFATLHLLPTAPPELVQAAHRALVKIHHPDVAGGDGQTMVRINLALERIREHQEEKAS
jgi:hypothetical protein